MNRLACVFDLDGTLLNTLADIAGACNTVLARHDYPQHPLAAYARMIGNGFDTLLKRAVPQERPPDAAALAALTQEARAVYARRMMDLTRPYPEMKETLSSLAAQGKKLCVLSNKIDDLTNILISHFFPEIRFCAICGAKPNLPLKPDPALLISMLQSLKVKPAQACYVGDSDVDMITAKNAGIAGIGAAWGYRSAAELQAADATLVINQPDELIGLTIPT